MHPKPPTKQQFGGLNLVVIALWMYMLAALLISTVFRPPPETTHLLDLTDGAIYTFFLLEFGVRFYFADNKLTLVRRGWIDLASSVSQVGVGLFGTFTGFLASWFVEGRRQQPPPVSAQSQTAHKLSLTSR